MNMKFIAPLLLLFSSFDNKTIAQNIPFEKIEYASFDVNSYRTKLKDKPFIGLYSVISKDGSIKINNDDDYHNTHTYHTYNLTASELKKLDSVFDAHKHLKSYLQKTKLESNSFYAGSYDFFLVTYQNGTKDSLCIIAPFMSTEFSNIRDMLDDIYYSKKGIKRKPFSIPENFKKSIILNYFKSKYLPRIQNPPSFRLED